MSEEGLHDLVLAGVATFAALEQAVVVWGSEDARTVPRIREMAALTRVRDQLREAESAEALARVIPADETSS